ncbi:PREDICTED: uncharacterized protein LOC108965373 [Bactrocera latifrons]|uniref:Uncharacterized protein n=1 Tax=Bactrocera latifrons TaxID=174628 RepID=A0A0K8UHL5_BACLA|nr:PREDICTED: uncharacterized protein LOC108965373 [Bactrocera latifrons]
MAVHKLVFSFFIISIVEFKIISTAPHTVNPKQNVSISITEDYKALRNDAQWFFQHVEIIADSLVQILPVVNKEGSRSLTSNTNNATFVENTRLTLLLGLRHMLVGVKEISVAFQRRLSGDHEQQLLYLKTVAQLLQDAIRFAKHWFSLLRNSLAEIFRLYNHYIPEVLLGKCFGKYITTAYPDRSFYEYPFILLGEVIDFGVTYLQSIPIYDVADKNNETPLPIEDVSDEQNEIWPDHMEKYSRSINSASDDNAQTTNTQHPWQKCLKMYAADSISRQLKLFFIGD